MNLWWRLPQVHFNDHLDTHFLQQACLSKNNRFFVRTQQHTLICVRLAHTGTIDAEWRTTSLYIQSSRIRDTDFLIWSLLISVFCINLCSS